MRAVQNVQGYCRAARQCQMPPATCAQKQGRDAGGHRRRQQRGRIADGEHVARLILAKPERMRGDAVRSGYQIGTDITGQRHFGHRQQQPAIGHVVASRDAPGQDARADEIAHPPLGRQIDRRWRPILAAGYFP